MKAEKKIQFDMCHTDASHLTLKRFGSCFNQMPSQVNLIPTFRDKADNFTLIIKEMASAAHVRACNKNTTLLSILLLSFYCNRSIAAVWPARRKQLILKGTAELHVFLFLSNGRWTELQRTALQWNKLPMIVVSITASVAVICFSFQNIGMSHSHWTRLYFWDPLQRLQMRWRPPWICLSKAGVHPFRDREWYMGCWIGLPD